VFGAFPGRGVNGEDFIPAAVAAGRVAVVARPEARSRARSHLADPNRAAPLRGWPRSSSRPVPETIVAVTGTNGKTSTSR
jgi:UDP-N-acetylmuramoyl-L-alanyl-D-glutamate--2,6-diaminopimelate ligase